MISSDADEVSAWTSKHGQNGSYDALELRHGCCHVRQVAPLRCVLVGKRAWLTGLRRQQSMTRRDLKATA
jgi:phosphoadenosine phosphosulfate reductase